MADTKEEIGSCLIHLPFYLLAVGDVVKCFLQYFPTLEIQEVGFYLNFFDNAGPGHNLRFQNLPFFFSQVLSECGRKYFLAGIYRVQNPLRLPDEFCPLSTCKSRQRLVAINDEACFRIR